MKLFFRRSLTSVALLILFDASIALGAAVNVISSGPGVFTVQGSAMNEVSGMELNLTYDAASLSSPTVTQGSLISGALMAANTSNPGSIKIAIISTKAFSDSGQIATVTFATQNGTGGITSASVSMINSKGAPVAAQIVVSGKNTTPATTPGFVTTPGVPFSQTGQTAQTGQTGQPGATSIPTYPGTVSLPSDLQQRADSQPAPSSATPAPAGEPESTATRITEQAQPPGTPADDTKGEKSLQYVVYKWIPDRFKHYSGSRTLPAMAMLFDKKVAQNIHQEPAILLSNEQSRATLTIDIPVRIISSPNFAVNGGKMVSFKEDKRIKGRWTVEVLPDAGAIRATLTIIAGAEETEYPLTIAPPAKTALTLDEIGWNRFLKEVGTTAAPLHDLNNDGVRDYMDEFIFVANYLAGKTNPARTAAPSKKSSK